MDLSADESDFYGQVEVIERLKARVQLADAGFASPSPTTAAAGTAAATVGSAADPAGQQHSRDSGRDSSRDDQELHNPFAGVPYAWQLGESIGNFLARLPPKTTPVSSHTPWIYICNPHASGRRESKSAAGSQAISGCEDEGPEADGAQTLLFVQGGRERLGLLRRYLDGLTASGLPPSVTARDTDNAKQTAARDILGLAGRAGVTCGKWMLFVPPGKVNAVWETVARATMRDQLGVAAKVAPRDPERASAEPRLICVYTADFRDGQDIGRVLLGLAHLGLVPAHGKRIYYKCDAYTYLGIGAGNPWGLRASLCSSHDVFESARAAGGTA